MSARSPRDVWLLARMCAWAAALPLLKFALPLPRLVRLLSAARRRARSPEAEARVVHLARRLYRAPRPGFSDNCLERSLVTYRYLGRLGADPSLVVAVGKERSDVIGHVWVTVDGRAVHDAPDELDRYVPLVVFSADGTSAAAAQPGVAPAAQE